MGDFDVRRILVDQGSSADLLQASVISHMGRNIIGLENPGRILSGFNGATTTSLGDIVLPVQAGPVTLNVQFSVVQDLSPFNVILGRTWLNYMKAIASTYHQMTIQISEEGTHLTYISSSWPDETGTSEEFTSLSSLIGLTSCQQQGPSDRGLDVFTRTGKRLSGMRLTSCWKPDSLEKWSIRTGWQMYFPLPRIDQIVDSTIGQRMLSFFDAFSGYHQIPMTPANEEKTTFITPHDLYCYKVMPFGLKNAGATYQRPMTKIFKPLVGRTVEVYIDDIVVKSKTRDEHVIHLQELKAIMETPPRSKRNYNVSQASSPLLGEKLYMYLAVSEWAISAVLFRCPSHKEQKPIYYVSRALADCRPEAPPLLPSPPRGRADRPAPSQHPAQAGPDRKNASMGHRVERIWNRVPTQIVHERPGSGVGLLLQSPIGEQLEQAIRLGFPTSNNEAEYEAILSGLDLALALSVSRLRVYSDSQLVRMTRYLTKVRDTLQRFIEWTIEKIKRTENGRADALAGIAAFLPIKEAILLPIHVQTNPSVAEASTCNTIKANHADDQDWTEAIIKYLRTGTLPEEPKQAHKTRVQAAHFTLIGGHLYKRSFTGSYLRCLDHSEALYVLAELHEGVCGNHSEGRSLAHRAHSQGYYWSTMKKDAAAYVKKCDKCQRHAPIPHVLSETLKPISGPWPFT
ncbi:hypothetical protein AAG906_022168 [Vitis piasezkii]